MRKISQVAHILRLISCYTRELPILNQGSKPMLRSLFVYKANNLCLICGGRGVNRGNIDLLTRIDEVIVFNRWVSSLDLRETHMIAYCYLP